MNHLHSRVTRGLALSAVALLLASCGGGGSADSPVVDDAFYPEPENEWELVWEDEFDGDALNSENWEPQIGDGSDYGLDRWGNGEQQRVHCPRINGPSAGRHQRRPGAFNKWEDGGARS